MNNELADRMHESAEDIIVAVIAPSPKNETQVGVKYCRTIIKSNICVFQ